MVPTQSVSPAFYPLFRWHDTKMECKKALQCGSPIYLWRNHPDLPNQRTFLSGSSREPQKGKLALYCQIVIYLLARYKNDDIFAEADVKIIESQSARRSECSGIFSALLDKSPILQTSLRRILSQRNVYWRTRTVDSTNRLKFLRWKQAGITQEPARLALSIANLQSGNTTPE